MSDSTPKSYSSDPTLWLYTSLSSGSSHIVTATSRLETILKANRVPFQALDVATDEKARMLWGRRAGKRKLPGLVRMGMVLADLEEVEEWNEYGEIKENLGSTAPAPTPSASITPSKPAPAAPPPPPETKPAVASHVKPTASTTPAPAANMAKSPEVKEEKPTLAGQMRSMGAEAAEKAKQMRTAKLKAMAAGASTAKTTSTAEGDSTATEKADTDVKSSSVTKDTEKADETEKTEDTGKVEDTEKAEDEKIAEAEKIVNTSKLDNSAPSGVPPPSGETDAKDAMAPETANAAVESKADDVPETTTQTSEERETGDAKGPESPIPLAEDLKNDPPSVNVDSSETAIKSSSSLAAANTSSLPSDTAPRPSHHRGSSLEIVDKDAIKEVEEATKIPEASDETEVDEEGGKVEEVASTSASDQKAVSQNQSANAESAIDDVKGTTTDKKDQEDEAEEKDDGHVKFGGEAQGEEIDRVKATLERSSPVGSMPPSAIASPKPEDGNEDDHEEDDDDDDNDDDKVVEKKEDKGLAKKETTAPETTILDKDKVEVKAADAASNDQAEALPGTKTQTQDAADPKKAGDSVAD